MIAYIKGMLSEIWEDAVVVEAAGVGYHIFVPVSVMDRLPKTGEEVKLYTYFQVREDAMNLYGFFSHGDLEMFRQLIGVNGIGPKAALGILSVLTPDDLRLAIISGDAKAISRAPGVGPKTAQRVILDLKDKVSLDDILPGGAGEIEAAEKVSCQGHLNAAGKEAVEALTALGYSPMEASRAVKQVEITETMTAEDVLKLSLKYLAFL